MKTTDGYEVKKGAYYYLANGQCVILDDCATYECEGGETLVYKIFKEVPLDLVHVDYKKKLKEVEALSLAIGVLKQDSKELSSENQKTTRAISAAAKELITAEGKVQSLKDELVVVDTRLLEKRQKLSELEDSISSLKSEDVSSLVSKTELQRLNKRDFLLNCLEGGGVDNWQWYDESLVDYRERYPN